MVHSFYVLLLLLVGTWILYRKIKSARYRYPPSPPKHWLLGNLTDLPRTIDREKLLSWRQNHGDITYLSALGKSLVILNTTDAIKELLDRRAKNYSDRPQTVVAGELMGLDQAIPSYNYTDRYRGLRKVVQQALNPTAVQKYQSIQLEAIKLALESIRKDPVHFKDHCQLAVSIMVTYGIDMKEADSTYMAHFEDLSDTINETLIPGSFLVDLVPVLKYLPKWFPFTYFHEAGARGRKLLNQSADPPFEYVQRCMATGDVPPSFVADLLADPEGLYKNMKHSPNVLLDVKYAASAMYFAGVETSFGTMRTFLMLMALHPEKQKKAQIEIDQVTSGCGKLVTLEDRQNMPYLRALMQEVSRWHIVVPLGLPRISVEDDIYNGYHIPAGTVVFPNAYAISREVADPECFIPERFLDAENPAQNPYEYMFGYGRRICPGRYLAENFLFLFAANTLAFFDIKEPSQDDLRNGLAHPADVKFSPTLVSLPENFTCRMEPRSQEHADIVASLTG